MILIGKSIFLNIKLTSFLSFLRVLGWALTEHNYYYYYHPHHCSLIESLENPVFDYIIKVGLYIGAIFQLCCIVAVIILPFSSPTSSPQNVSAYYV